MREWQSQSHVRWYCRYHVVIVPKYRRKSMFGVLRKDVGAILRELCRRFGIELVEGHVMPDHVHMCLSVPPKYSVAHAVGKLKGKSAILIHQKYGRSRNVIGFRFWSRGYCVSTVGLEEAVIRNYIRTQEEREIQERADELAILMKILAGSQPPVVFRILCQFFNLEHNALWRIDYDRLI